MKDREFWQPAIDEELNLFNFGKMMLETLVKDQEMTKKGSHESSNENWNQIEGKIRDSTNS